MSAFAGDRISNEHQLLTEPKIFLKHCINNTLRSFLFSQNQKMKVFVVLFITILGSCEVLMTSTIENDLGIGVLTKFNNNFKRKKIDDKVLNLVENSRDLADVAVDVVKGTNVGMKMVQAGTSIFESKIKKKIGEAGIKLLPKTMKFAAKMLPIAGEIIDIVESLITLFEDQNDGKSEFMEKILKQANTDSEKTALTENLNKIKDVSILIKDDLPFIAEKICCMKNEYEKENQYNESEQRVPYHLITLYLGRCHGKGVDKQISDIHGDLQKIEYAITRRNTIYRRFALMGAPVFTELSLMVTYFEPIAMETMEDTANHVNLPCRYRDVLVDFLPFALGDRFSRVLNTNVKDEVRNEPYNRSDDQLVFYVSQFCRKGCNGKSSCIVDEFSENNISSPWNSCAIYYLRYLKQLVENMFPIDTLNKACNRNLTGPSGNL